MRKIFVSFLIIFLIFATTITKNSTKNLDKEIYKIKDDLRFLKNKHELVLLEHNYLSSPKRLLVIQKDYFENELRERDLSEFGKIIINKNTSKIIQFIQNEKLKKKNNFRRIFIGF